MMTGRRWRWVSARRRADQQLAPLRWSQLRPATSGARKASQAGSQTAPCQVGVLIAEYLAGALPSRDARDCECGGEKARVLVTAGPGDWQCQRGALHSYIAAGSG
jgi:hypothetical protein